MQFRIRGQSHAPSKSEDVAKLAVSSPAVAYKPSLALNASVPGGWPG